MCSFHLLFSNVTHFSTFTFLFSDTQYTFTINGPQQKFPLHKNNKRESIKRL